jgi:hypothetical protein
VVGSAGAELLLDNQVIETFRGNTGWQIRYFTFSDRPVSIADR